MATTFTGGLKSILNSTNTSRADIHVNNIEIDGDITLDGDMDVKGQICINDGVSDLVCLSSTALDKKSPDEDFEIKNSNAGRNVKIESVNFNGSTIGNLGSLTSLVLQGDTGVITESASDTILRSTGGNIILNANHAAGNIFLRTNNTDRFSIATNVLTTSELDFLIDRTSATAFRVRTDAAANIFSVNTDIPSARIDGALVVDDNNSNALSVRKDGGGTLVLNVNTSGAADRVEVGGNGLRFTGGGNVNLNYYEAGTHNTNWTGGITPDTAANITYQRIGNVVTLSIPALVATGAASVDIQNVTALPASLRPAAVRQGTTYVLSNSTDILGIFTVSTGGVIAISPTDAAFNGPATFPASGNNGWTNAIQISYHI